MLGSFDAKLFFQSQLPEFNLEATLNFLRYCREKDFKTAHTIAINNNTININASFSEPPLNYSPALILAIKYGTKENRGIDLLKYLLQEKKLDLNVTDENGKKALDLAIEANNVELEKKLINLIQIQNGKDKNKKNSPSQPCLSNQCHLLSQEIKLALNDIIKENSLDSIKLFLKKEN